MGKSIEEIWKDGFLKSDALIAPKINKLYSQKSIHIIDKFKRMFRKNLIAIAVGSLSFLIVSYFLHIAVMGVLFFIMMIALLFINIPLLRELENIDKGQNSYDYLKTFSHWIQKQIAVNKRFAMFMYPILFIAIVLGAWYSDTGNGYLGERIASGILVVFPDTYLLFGVPLFAIVIGLIIIALLIIFGGRIYMWDLNVIYGRVLKKLDELLEDIEKIRSQDTD